MEMNGYWFRSAACRVRVTTWVIAPALLVCAYGVHGQTAPSDPTVNGKKGTVTKDQDGFRLTLTSEVDELTAATAATLVSTFFNALLNECAEFDWGCPRTSFLNIVPSIPDCAGIKEPGACTEDNTISVNFAYLKKYPLDTELVTHEAMHLLQSYAASTDACSYWAEGLADFARDRYGDATANAAAQWSLKQGNSPTDSYEKTGHFLSWVAQRHAISTVVALHNQLKTGCPDDAFWKDETTLGLDELWTTYAD
jgi:hypothetical protein